MAPAVTQKNKAIETTDAAQGQKHLLPFTCVNGLIQKQLGSRGSTLWIRGLRRIWSFSAISFSVSLALSTGGADSRDCRESWPSTSHATPPPPLPLVEPKVNTTGFAVLVNMYVGILRAAAAAVSSPEMLNKRLAGSHWEWSEWGCCVLAGSLASS